MVEHSSYLRSIYNNLNHKPTANLLPRMEYDQVGTYANEVTQPLQQYTLSIDLCGIEPLNTTNLTEQILAGLDTWVAIWLKVLRLVYIFRT